MKGIISLMGMALISGAALAQEGMPQEEPGAGKPSFEEVDANQDQRISSMEARSYQDIATAFAQADSNKDGYLSRDEFMSIS